MELKKLPDDIVQKLRTPFPSEAITKHPTKTYLSTIKAIYVTERLNEVFGIGQWMLHHWIIDDTPEYVASAGYIELYEYGIRTPVQYGGHTKVGVNTEPADGYKSSATDVQSKCASYLEIGIDVFKGTGPPPPGNAAAQPAGQTGKTGQPEPKHPPITEGTPHFCHKHNTKFFKKGKMKGYAHPVTDDNAEPVMGADGKPEWCNEDDVDKIVPPYSEQSDRNAIISEIDNLCKKLGLDTTTAKAEKFKDSGGLGYKPAEDELYSWMVDLQSAVEFKEI